MTSPLIMNVVIIKEYGGWSTGLFGCFEDCESCMAAFCCFGIYRCFLANKLGESFMYPCCACFPTDLMVLRMKVRTMNRINGSALEDCCVSSYCSACVAAQLSREWDNTH
ncbi:placenta-specific gene 8 protein-like [Saccoglossus kowalevskii]|uniref:Cell number regulator 4-like n=1 Tax=Saccoglossus kowalevskii TaxID=10224 RepID=A0ABM0MSL0_SACKO|nr:PREDICTED: cell number regulator 4-like [Saccoglossus kowalevskii]